MSDETYRMLGREHQADLERHAAAWRLAAEARSNIKPTPVPSEPEQPRERTGLVALLVRFARASG
jgi:hypothetical protein